MIQTTDLVVLKNDGSTSVTYVAKTASSGSLPASWKLDAASAISAFRPSFQLSARPNGPKTAARVQAKFTYPLTITVEGREHVVGTIPVEVSAAVPYGVDDAAIAEAITQAFNLLNTSLVKDAFKHGVAPV